MVATIIFIIVIVLIAYGVSQVDKARKEVAERREQYVQSLDPDTRIIVNDGIHLFFKNDVKQFFGIDEWGKTYSFSGLLSVSKFKDTIMFQHKDGRSDNLCVGKDPLNNDTKALHPLGVQEIYSEMMPVLRKNLHKELGKYGVKPTHEYDIDGTIWGCDLNSEKFFCMFAGASVYDFSELKRVTIDDIRNNTLISGSYIINVYVNSAKRGAEEYDIYIDTPDTTYYNLLSMFKGIRNRQRHVRR